MVPGGRAQRPEPELRWPVGLNRHVPGGHVVGPGLELRAPDEHAEGLEHDLRRALPDRWAR